MRKNVMRSLPVPSVSMNTNAGADLVRLTPLPQIEGQRQVQEFTLKGYSIQMLATAHDLRLW